MCAEISARVHLISGSTGAGKTTYARNLASELRGMLFSIDDWMVTLFGDDVPKDLVPSWFVPRVERCETQIWASVAALGKLGVPSVLDLGFQKFEHRCKFADLAEKAGLSVKLHFLDVDASERWRRVERRNDERGDTFHMTITRGMFDYIETIWEPPGKEEVLSLGGEFHI